MAQATTVTCPSCQKVTTTIIPNGASFQCPRCQKAILLTLEPEENSADTIRPAIQGTPKESFPCNIGHFQIRKKLGTGAFGVVYLAYDPRLDREIALKVPHPATLTNQEKSERFVREARAAAKLRHPNIVTVFEIGQSEATSFIASDFVKGKPLSQVIEEGGVDAFRAARLVAFIADALAYAHDSGIVHRDVKPSNIIVDEQGEPHLIDFGMVHLREGAECLTQEGVILGTPAYMAPEQAEGKKEAAQPACDQYSLGVVLYELLCGERPFRGQIDTLLYQIIHSTPPTPRSVNSEIPKRLESICLKTLEKHPHRRFPSCQAFASELRNWLNENTPGKPQPRRRLPLYVAGLLALIGLVATLAVIVIRLSSERGEGVLALESLDPNVEIIVRKAGKEVAVLDKRTKPEVTLPVGQYELELRPGKEGLKLETTEYVLKQGDRAMVRVLWEAKAQME